MRTYICIILSLICLGSELTQAQTTDFVGVTDTLGFQAKQKDFPVNNAWSVTQLQFKPVEDSVIVHILSINYVDGSVEEIPVADLIEDQTIQIGSTFSYTLVSPGNAIQTITVKASAPLGSSSTLEIYAVRTSDANIVVPAFAVSQSNDTKTLHMSVVAADVKPSIPSATVNFHWEVLLNGQNVTTCKSDDNLPAVDCVLPSPGLYEVQLHIADSAGKTAVGSFKGELKSTCLDVNLSVVRSGNLIRVSWPGCAADYLLESTVSLTNPVWTLVPKSEIFLVEGNFLKSFDTSGSSSPSLYVRLRRP